YASQGNRPPSEGGTLACALDRADTQVRPYPAADYIRVGTDHRRSAFGIGVALQAFQIGAHIGRYLIAQGARFLQRVLDDVLQLCRAVGLEFHRRGGSLAENSVENRGDTRA